MTPKISLTLVILHLTLNHFSSTNAFAIGIIGDGGNSYCDCLEPPLEAETFSIVNHSTQSIKIDWPKQFDLEVYIDNDLVAYFNANRKLCYGNACSIASYSNDGIISGLEPDKTYTIYVRSGVNGIYSNFSEPIEFQINSSILPPLAEIQTINYKKDSVTIIIDKAWDFLDYTLFKDGEPILERTGKDWVLFSDDSLMYEGDHCYVIRVSSSLGGYIDSNTVCLSDLPTPVREISVDQRTSSSISVSWPQDAKTDEYFARIDGPGESIALRLDQVYSGTTQGNNFTFTGLKAGSSYKVSVTPKNSLGSSYSLNPLRTFTFFSNNSHFSIDDGLPDSTEFRWGGEESPLFVAIRGYALYVAGEKSTPETILEVTIRNFIDAENVSTAILKIGPNNKTELINTPESSIISVSQDQTQFEFISNVYELLDNQNPSHIQITYEEVLGDTTINFFPNSQESGDSYLSFDKIKDNNKNGTHDYDEPLKLVPSDRIRLKVVDGDSLEFKIKDGMEYFYSGTFCMPYKLDQLGDHSGELPGSYKLRFFSNDIIFVLPMEEGESSAFYQILCPEPLEYENIPPSNEPVLNKWNIR